MAKPESAAQWFTFPFPVRRLWGVICQKRGQMADAARYYERALEQKPEFAEALLNLGHARKALGDERGARACWRKAVETKPEFAEGYFDPAGETRPA